MIVVKKNCGSCWYAEGGVCNNHDDCHGEIHTEYVCQSYLGVDEVDTPPYCDTGK